jgi:hypothetical protein
MSDKTQGPATIAAGLHRDEKNLFAFLGYGDLTAWNVDWRQCLVNLQAEGLLEIETVHIRLTPLGVQVLDCLRSQSNG